VRLDEEEECSGSNELREVEEDMLVVWVQAMCREIAGCEIVVEIVERRNYRIMEKVGPVNLLVRIESRI